MFHRTGRRLLPGPWRARQTPYRICRCFSYPLPLWREPWLEDLFKSGVLIDVPKPSRATYRRLTQRDASDPCNDGSETNSRWCRAVAPCRPLSLGTRPPRPRASRLAAGRQARPRSRRAGAEESPSEAWAWEVVPRPAGVTTPPWGGCHRTHRPRGSRSAASVTGLEGLALRSGFDFLRVVSLDSVCLSRSTIETLIRALKKSLDVSEAASRT